MSVESLKTHGRKVAAALLVTAGVAGGAAAMQRPTAEPLTLMAATPLPTAAPTVTATPAPIVVYVSGEVAAPGVYTLSPGDRVVDAIVAAGGLSAEADAAAVNQATLLQDEMQVHVPRVGEAATPLPVSSGGGAQSGAKLNINRATALELEALPEIGPALAEAIVRHRDVNGDFRSVESLLDVSGIGEATLAAIRDLITVE